jgi:hypothetical protein
LAPAAGFASRDFARASRAHRAEGKLPLDLD